MENDALDIVREAFTLMLLISAPILAVGLVVGLVVSILQAVTQIQEQTLVFVPKILAMVAATVVVATARLGQAEVVATPTPRTSSMSPLVTGCR